MKTRERSGKVKISPLLRIHTNTSRSTLSTYSTVRPPERVRLKGPARAPFQWNPYSVKSILAPNCRGEVERKEWIYEGFMHHMRDEVDTYEIKTLEADIKSSVVC